MGGFSISTPIDPEEVIEACAVFARWKGRGDELPVSLRAQFDAVATGEQAVEVAQEGQGFALVLTPEVRALVANLRARD